MPGAKAQGLAEELVLQLAAEDLSSEGVTCSSLPKGNLPFLSVTLATLVTFTKLFFKYSLNSILIFCWDFYTLLFCWFCFERNSHCVAQAGLELESYFTLQHCAGPIPQFLRSWLAITYCLSF